MRKLFICMLLVLSLFALSGVALAQDTFCGGLSAADCEILAQSAEASANLTSSTFTFHLNISSGADALPLSGDGSYAVDPSVLEGFDPESFGGDPTAVFGALGGLLEGLDFSLNLDLGIGAPINLLLIEGTGYLNFEPLAPLLGGPQALTQMGLPAGWAGLDLVGALEMFGPMLGGMGGMEGFGDLGTSTPSEMDSAAQEQLMGAVEQYVTITRQADEGNNAVFSTTVDFAGLFGDEAFLGFIMEQAAASGTEISEAELAEAEQMMQAMGSGFSFSATQSIDLSSFYTTGFSFELNIDGTTIGAISGEAMDSVLIAADFNFADFNSAPALSAPAGARVFTVMELLGGMGDMGGF